MTLGLIVASVMAVFLGSIAWGINYTVHIDMVKSHCKQYGWGTLDQFATLFSKYEWVPDIGWPSSLFPVNEIELYTSNKETEIHANIFQFDGKGFIFKNPVSYLIAGWHIRQYIKNYYREHPSKQGIDWSKNL